MSERVVVSIACDPADAVSGAMPVQSAVAELRQALAARGVAVHLVETVDEAPAGGVCILVASPASRAAREILDRAGAALPPGPEGVALVPGAAGSRVVVLATGTDIRGLTYAVLELADRATHADDPASALTVRQPVLDQPANPIRSVTRLFSSDLEDRPWLHDRCFWQRYLAMLVSHRFNRFSLTLGLTYNFPRKVRETYFYFPYPFLLDVPGYDVRVPQLPEAERQQNLAALQMIGQEATARGLDFHIGLWTHAYAWIDSPEPNFTVEGLTPDNHAAYCRDALHALLEACPEISGVTFRAHVESGIPDGSYDFWRTVFDGMVRTGRRIEINIHSKGIAPQLIDDAVATGLPVVVSAKYTAEHQGLPYHQAAIRDLERSTTTPEGRPSTIPRRFTRYGYADYLAENRRYDVMYRLFPGTQRVLLWGDPQFAAAYGRFGTFGGSLGVEVMEPLTFKGRRGSGRPGGRDGYQDESLRARHDWEKYGYTYRLLGRLLYNPAAPADTWRRALRAELGQASAAAEAALATASRVLPLVTSAYLPSADDNKYWPELYTNMPIVWDAGEDGQPRAHPYSDTLAPKRFGNASPLDPALFASIEESVDEALRGKLSGRHTPLEVARWLEALASDASRHLAVAEAAAGSVPPAAFRRLVIDVAIQISLARFFAHKLRAGVSYTLFRRTGTAGNLDAALEHYQHARAGWAAAATYASGVYHLDLSYGEPAYLRGHWTDRLEGIDQDIADMAAERHCATHAPAAQGAGPAAATAARLLFEEEPSPEVWCTHTPPPSFRPSQAVPIGLTLPESGAAAAVTAVRLHYRRVDQRETYRVATMERAGQQCSATIPATYSASPFPLQYFFTLHDARGRAWPFPGLAGRLADQPYFVLRPA